MTLKPRLCAAILASFLSVHTLANDFSQFFSSFETLSADFHQVLLDVQDRQLETSQGQLLFARPGRLRWQTNEPGQQVLLLNDQQLYLIDYDLEQVSQRSLDSSDNSPLYWLSHASEAQRASVAHSHHHQGIDWYRANESLSFGFENAQLRAIRHTNALAQTLLIQLDNLAINPEVDPQQFKPVIPPGFDLIKLF